MLPLAAAALICHDATGSDAVGDADNSSCTLAWAYWGFTLTSRTKRVRPEQNPAQTQRVHPNDQPLAGVTQVIEHLN